MLMDFERFTQFFRLLNRVLNLMIASITFFKVDLERLPRSVLQPWHCSKLRLEKKSGGDTTLFTVIETLSGKPWISNILVQSFITADKLKCRYSQWILQCCMRSALLRTIDDQERISGK